MRWWSTKHQNDVHKLLLQYIPIFTCWNLWKNRCSCRYDGKTLKIYKVKCAVFKYTIFLLSINFPYIRWPYKWKSLISMLKGYIHDVNVIKVSMIKGYIHDVEVIKVCWQKPTADFVKLNTNGSALDNLGKMGVSGICRNHLGDLIFDFSSPMGVGYNNQVVLEVAYFGLCWCLHLGYKKVILEMDSELSMKWTNHQTYTSWLNSHILSKIYGVIIQFINFRCCHNYR